MTIKFRCPSGHLLSAPESRTGKKVCCPVCRQYMIVPEAAGNQPALANEGGSEEKESTKRRKRWADRKRRKRGTPDGTRHGAEPPPVPRPPRRWRSPKPAQRTMPVDVYRPDRGKIQTIKWLAFILGLTVLLSAIPAFAHLNLATAPGWARLVLLMAALEAVFIAWMLAAPDWSTVWVVMLVFAVAATVYGAATALAIATPPDQPMPLGMGSIRAAAGRWCMAMLLTTSLATYLCGRTSAKWRRQFELEMAGKDKPARGKQ